MHVDYEDFWISRFKVEKCVFVGEGGIIRDGVVTQPDRNQKLRSPM
jgi:hypothetical protein